MLGIYFIEIGRFKDSNYKHIDMWPMENVFIVKNSDWITSQRERIVRRCSLLAGSIAAASMQCT